MDTRSTQRSTHINSLPIEVLLQVFSYLPPTYLYVTVSKVCKYWEDLCEDPYFYKMVEFRGHEISLETYIEILKLAPLLEALTLVDVECMDEIVQEVSQHNHKIRSLVLKETRTPCVKQRVHMMKIIQNCTELQTLILRGCCVRKTKIYNNVFCMRLPHLKTLHLDNVRDSGSKVAAQLANCCFELENLQIYDESAIMSKYMSSKYIIALCSRFQKTLRSLRLGGGHWSQETFRALLKCDHLETLGICWPNNISNKDILTISLIPNLRRLELKLHNFPPERLIQLFTSGDLTNLVTLQLCIYNITDEVAAAIGDHLKNLQIVTLQFTGHPHPGKHDLTRIGVEKVIKGCLRLLELNVKLHGAEDDVKEVLLLIPEYLPGLKELKLCLYSRSYVFNKTESVEAIVQLETRMPHLKLQLTV